MTKAQYNRFMFLIRVYLKLDGYKMKKLKHNQPSHTCNKCSSVNQAEKLGILYPFTNNILIFYVSKCESCKTAYVYNNLEVIHDTNQ